MASHKQNEPETITETSEPVSEEPIKLVHVLNPGEREYLSPNLIGVQNIAMTFLPLSMNFINIVDAFREIVNGVKYDIVVNAVDTNDNDAEIVCHLVILEKPWLRTEWGDKVRELQHSNCSSNALEEDGDQSPRNPLVRANSINDKYVEEEPIIVRSKRSANTLGGGTPLDTDKAEKILLKSLNKIATGEGPSYGISKIYTAERKTVAGTLTTIDADLVTPDGKVERCQVEIWTRAWFSDGNEVTIKCPHQDVVKRRHSRSVEYAEKKTHKKSNHHNLSKVEHLFSKFQVKYKRRYHTTMERQMRLRIFKQNLKIIQELNANEMGSAKYGITEFADLTSTEYKQRTGLWQRDPVKAALTPRAEIPDIDLPKEFDWREKGVISPVKNQGNCGSCWAFSVTGNVEGLHAVKTGKLEEYSEQELLDCDTTDSACNGGLPDNAYEAIERIGGLELESEYPYHARKEQCHFNKAKVHVRVKGHVDLPKNETAMAQWLIKNGPISIGINANAMQFYRGGVSHPWRPLCSHSNLDHGVLIVGYGVSDYPMFNKTLPYWIVKNSWGSKWGEQGYYRVYRGDNTCGVSEMASSAVLADD
ncbi:putative cysteine proteinase CG12163 [Musca vetustissima]|uniref:putative cysteine proteinase CG12163 n=1 Tax=Musca vetustissima TaxID=27455 RepID=UPI002AB6BBDA|nr:putative cysteine proteinase CG12163 [Musca vetustissima]